MPVYTQVPNADLDGSTSWTKTGGTNILTILADAYDATYITGVINKSNFAFLGYPTQALGTGERIVSVATFARVKKTSDVSKYHLFAVCDRNGDKQRQMTRYIPKLTSITNDEMAADQGAIYVNYKGVIGEWGVAKNTSDEVLTYKTEALVSGGNESTVSIYQMRCKLYTTEPASVANPSAPTGTVETTQTPDCTVTVSADVEDWQLPTGRANFCTKVKVEFAIYAGTFTTRPAGEPVQLWSVMDEIAEVGAPSSIDVTSEVPEPLANGDYTLFVRVLRDHPIGINAAATPAAAWSADAYVQWTQDVPLPEPPVLTLTPEAEDERIRIAANVASLTGYDDDSALVTVQRQTDDGWREVGGITATPIVAGHTATVGADSEYVPGALTVYRAQASLWSTADEVRRYSDWSVYACVAPERQDTGWTLIPLDDLTLKWTDIPLTHLQEQQQGETATFTPLDRDRPVVVSGPVAGTSASFDVTAIGSTQIAALAAIAAYRGPLRLVTPFGDARIVAITKASWGRGGVVGGEVRKASIDCIEVGDSTTLYPFADMRVGRSIFALWDAARADGGIYPGYNDPAFTTWTDASANGNDATLHGFDGTESSGWGGMGTDADPYYLRSSADSEYVELPACNVASDGEGTVECWFRTSTAQDAYLLSLTDGTSEEFSLALTTTGVLVAFRNDATARLVAPASGTQDYADGAWHHLAGRVSDGELQCFFDGLPLGAAVAVDTGTQSLSTGALFAALFASVTDRFAGDIALAAVYSDALSDGEIAQNYVRGPA